MIVGMVTIACRHGGLRFRLAIWLHGKTILEWLYRCTIVLGSSFWRQFRSELGTCQKLGYSRAMISDVYSNYKNVTQQASISQQKQKQKFGMIRENIIDVPASVHMCEYLVITVLIRSSSCSDTHPPRKVVSVVSSYLQTL